MEYNSGSNRASNFKLAERVETRNALKEYLMYKILITTAYNWFCCIVNFSNSCFLCLLNQYSVKQVVKYLTKT